MREPIDAFAWLIEQFRGYTCCKLTWLDVKRVLAEAEIHLDYYRSQEVTDARNQQIHYPPEL